MQHPRYLWLGACLVALSACNPGGSIPCTAGEQKTCGCPGGAPDGVQVCAADGTYGACDCGSSTTTSTGGGGAGTGGNGTGGNGTGANGTGANGTGGNGAGGNTTGGNGTGGNTGGNNTGGNATGGNGTGGNTGGNGGNGTGGAGGSTMTTMPMPCDNVYQGSFTLQSSLDVSTIAPYCEITGNLMVNAAGLSTVALPNLRKLGGTLDVQSTLTSLDLHALESAGTVMAFADVINLSSLTSCGGFSTIHAKTPVSLPALVSFTGHLGINAKDSVDLPNLDSSEALSIGTNDCPAGIAVSMPKLTTGKGLTMTCLKSLVIGPVTSLSNVTIEDLTGPKGVNFSFPVLASVDAFDIGTTGSVSAPNLVTITTGDLRIKRWSSMDLGKLKTIGHDLWMYGSTVTNLNLPSLELIGNTFKLGGQNACNASPPDNPNTELVQLTLPKLATLGGAQFNGGSIFVGQNPKLPQCRFDALVAQLQQHGWIGYVDNSHPAVCTFAAGPCP